MNNAEEGRSSVDLIVERTGCPAFMARSFVEEIEAGDVEVQTAFARWVANEYVPDIEGGELRLSERAVDGSTVPKVLAMIARLRRNPALVESYHDVHEWGPGDDRTDGS